VCYVISVERHVLRVVARAKRSYHVVNVFATCFSWSLVPYSTARLCVSPGNKKSSHRSWTYVFLTYLEHVRIARIGLILNSKGK